MREWLSMFKRLVRYQAGGDKRVLCPVCARDNRRAFSRLVYRVQGRHTCEKCGREFVVSFKANVGNERRQEPQEGKRHEKN